MLYIGYFRFEFDDSEVGASEGRFTFAVEADSVDEACQRMAVTIPEQYGDLLQNATQLFLDDVIEIAALPPEGIVLRAEQGPSHPDDALITFALPNYDGEQCTNYRQGPDPEEDLEAASEYVQQPFIEFEDLDAE